MTRRGSLVDMNLSLAYMGEKRKTYFDKSKYMFFSEKKSFRFAIYSDVDQKMQTIRMFKYKIYICHILLIRHEFVS